MRGEYSDKQQSTLQASYLDKRLVAAGTSTQLSIWDTAGQERFHSLGPIYYRDAGEGLGYLCALTLGCGHERVLFISSVYYFSSGNCKMMLPAILSSWEEVSHCFYYCYNNTILHLMLSCLKLTLSRSGNTFFRPNLGLCGFYPSPFSRNLNFEFHLIHFFSAAQMARC